MEIDIPKLKLLVQFFKDATYDTGFYAGCIETSVRLGSTRELDSYRALQKDALKRRETIAQAIIDELERAS